MGMSNGMIVVKNYIAVPQNIKNLVTIWPRNLISQNIGKRIKSRASKVGVYTHVYCSIVHNRENMKVIQIAIDQWLNKQYTAWRQWNVSLKRKETLCDPTNMKFWKKQKLIENIRVDARCRREKRMKSVCPMGSGVQFSKMKKFWRWMVVMTAQHECT